MRAQAAEAEARIEARIEMLAGRPPRPTRGRRPSARASGSRSPSSWPGWKPRPRPPGRGGSADRGEAGHAADRRALPRRRRGRRRSDRRIPCRNHRRAAPDAGDAARRAQRPARAARRPAGPAARRPRRRAGEPDRPAERSRSPPPDLVEAAEASFLEVYLRGFSAPETASEPAPERPPEAVPEAAPAAGAVLPFHAPHAATVSAPPEAASDLGKLPGAGPGLVQALGRAGLARLADLAPLEPEALAARLGPIGRLIPAAAWIAVARAETAAPDAEATRHAARRRPPRARARFRSGRAGSSALKFPDCRDILTIGRFRPIGYRSRGLPVRGDRRGGCGYSAGFASRSACLRR